MNLLPELDLHLLGLSAELQAGEPVCLLGSEIRPCILPAGLETSMTCSWDDFFERLGRLERMFPEPDGSFMWVGFEGNQDWQLNGMVYDRAGIIQWCEIKGKCPSREWQMLLKCFGWPNQQLVIQFPQEQVFVQKEELDKLWQ